MSKFKKATAIRRELDRYRQFMLEHEYTAATSTGYGTYLSWFLCLPVQEDVNSLKENILSFLKVKSFSSKATFKGCRAALHLYFKMITGKRFSKRQPTENNPEIETIVKRFYDYSVNIKRIRPKSAISEAATIRKFLRVITSHLEVITAFEIRNYAITHLKHLTDSSKGKYITAIRNFFRFKEFEGLAVHKSIFQLPLSPAVWKNAAFPKTMEISVFNRLHEIPDSNTPIGKRDRCIILCFTELALRCIEVAALTVDDFNWRESYVIIKNTKNHLDRKLPVSEKLGKTVIEYLSNARVKTASRVLFVRFKHSCGEPMGEGQIRGVIRRVLVKTGLKIKPIGPQILRKTAASKIYNAGNSLKMTADILGHESLVSTVQYVKTDIARLRNVAAPWPGKQEKDTIL
ncbi:MAG: tyrosine-type recombinase/integrase [Treponema sp.]|nr:tyrosine-type recombinase/integrase [Treponema sp.]